MQWGQTGSRPALSSREAAWGPATGGTVAGNGVRTRGWGHRSGRAGRGHGACVSLGAAGSRSLRKAHPPTLWRPESRSEEASGLFLFHPAPSLLGLPCVSESPSLLSHKDSTQGTRVPSDSSAKSNFQIRSILRYWGQDPDLSPGGQDSDLSAGGWDSNLSPGGKNSAYQPVSLVLSWGSTVCNPGWPQAP